MTEVQFEEQMESYSTQQRVGQKKDSLLVRMVMRLGLAKNTHEANIVFIVVTVISIILSVAIFAHYILGYNPFAKNRPGGNAVYGSLRMPGKK